MSFGSKSTESLDHHLQFESGGQAREEPPKGNQRLGWFTVQCLILNRTIGENQQPWFGMQQLNLLNRHRYLRNTTGYNSRYWECRGLAHSLGLGRNNSLSRCSCLE